MWKGKPIGDGTPFEAERALKPCEFNSRSFRLVLDECAIGRAAKVFTGGWRISHLATIDSPTQLIMTQRVRTSNPVRSVRLRHGSLFDE